MRSSISPYAFLAVVSLPFRGDPLFAWGQETGRAAPRRSSLQLAVFAADVTPPLGHPLMGGGIAPAKKVEDPLFAHGWVLLGAGKPIVFAAIDWREIRNDAYERWRTVLAEAARTT